MKKMSQKSSLFFSKGGRFLRNILVNVLREDPLSGQLYLYLLKYSNGSGFQKKSGYGFREQTALSNGLNLQVQEGFSSYFDIFV